jgi:hypothetical protein
VHKVFRALVSLRPNLEIDQKTDKYPSRSAAGDLQAKTAEAEETDEILKYEGYLVARHWTNEKVEDVFGTCSTQHHRLIALQNLHQDREEREAFVAQWKVAPKDIQGCRPYRDVAAYVGSYSKLLNIFCESCDKTLPYQVYASRLVAISKLSYLQLWKAVLPRKYSETSYVFEGSARCNGFGHKGRNHCMTPSHLNMETVQHNARRKSHHRGTAKCRCYRLCIGKQVMGHPTVGCCGPVFRCGSCKNSKFWRRMMLME